MLHTLLLASDVLAVVPNPTAGQPPGFAGILVVLGWVKWGCYALCLVGVLIAAGLWAVDRWGRGGSGEHVTGIAISVIAAIVVGAAGGLINAVAT